MGVCRMNRIECGTHGGSLSNKRPCRTPMSGCFCSGAMNERIEWIAVERGATKGSIGLERIERMLASGVCWHQMPAGKVRVEPLRTGWRVKRCLNLLAWLLGFREWLGSLVPGKGMRECFLHVGLWG